MPQKIIEDQIKREEKQIIDGMKLKGITEKQKKDPVFRAVMTAEDGTNTEFNSQEEMVQVIAESNRLRQQQCGETPFMTSLLVDIFGYLAKP